MFYLLKPKLILLNMEIIQIHQSNYETTIFAEIFLEKQQTVLRKLNALLRRKHITSIHDHMYFHYWSVFAFLQAHLRLTVSLGALIYDADNISDFASSCCSQRIPFLRVRVANRIEGNLNHSKCI